MELTPFDRTVLQFIWNSFPFSFDLNANRPTTVDEMALPSRDVVTGYFKANGVEIAVTEAAIKKLVSFQLIAKKELLYPEFVTEQGLGVRIVKMPMSSDTRWKEDCYQVTESGKTQIKVKVESNAKMSKPLAPQGTAWWIFEAIRQIPSFKYAVGVVALVAVSAICQTIGVGGWLAILYGAIAALAGMILIRLYVEIKPKASSVDVSIQVKILIWTVVVALVVLVIFGITRVGLDLFIVSFVKAAKIEAHSPNLRFERASFKNSDDVIDIMVFNPTDTEVLIREGTIRVTAITPLTNAVRPTSNLISSGKYPVEFPDRYVTLENKPFEPFEFQFGLEQVIRPKSHDRFEIHLPSPRAYSGQVISFSMLLDVSGTKLFVGDYDLLAGFRLTEFSTIDNANLLILSKRKSNKNHDFTDALKIAEAKAAGDEELVQLLLKPKPRVLDKGEYIPPTPDAPLGGLGPSVAVHPVALAKAEKFWCDSPPMKIRKRDSAAILACAGMIKCGDNEEQHPYQIELEASSQFGPVFSAFVKQQRATSELILSDCIVEVVNFEKAILVSPLKEPDGGVGAPGDPFVRRPMVLLVTLDQRPDSPTEVRPWTFRPHFIYEPHTDENEHGTVTPWKNGNVVIPSSSWIPFQVRLRSVASGIFTVRVKLTFTSDFESSDQIEFEQEPQSILFYRSHWVQGVEDQLMVKTVEGKIRLEELE